MTEVAQPTQTVTRPTEITRHVESEVLDTAPHPPLDVDLIDCRATTRHVLTDDSVPAGYAGPREFTIYMHCPPRNPTDKTWYFTWPATETEAPNSTTEAQSPGNATTSDGDAVHAVEFYGYISELRRTYRHDSIKSILDATPGPDPEFDPWNPHNRDDLKRTRSQTPLETNGTRGPGTGTHTPGAPGDEEPSAAYRGATGELAAKYLSEFNLFVGLNTSLGSGTRSGDNGLGTVTDWEGTFNRDPVRVAEQVAANTCEVSSPEVYQSNGGTMADPPRHVQQYLDALTEKVQVPPTIPVLLRPVFNSSHMPEFL